ncbi:MAG: hypothetical protein NVS2B12_03010 [Ktedonobacteraceae bacterium]
MLRYRLDGSGPPLLLIHGWGVTYATWQNLAPLLRPYFQLVMIELPGVGGSPQVAPHQPYYHACAEAIEEVRCALGIKQWYVLAYSSGTRAAEAYVQRYPQSIMRVIFLCPTYILEIWAQLLRLLNAPHPLTLRQWVLSDWRLRGLVRTFGFNGERSDYTYVWTHEIELQSSDTLLRSLREMPGRGRAPFNIPSVPTLFVWGGQDVLIAPPRPLGPDDVIIPANHSAPMLAAPYVAEVVLPFLLDGKKISIYQPQRRVRYSRRSSALLRGERKRPTRRQKRSGRRFSLRRPKVVPQRVQ